MTITICPHEPEHLYHSHLRDTLDDEPDADCQCDEDERLWIAPSDRGTICIRDGYDCTCAKPLLPLWARKLNKIAD